MSVVTPAWARYGAVAAFSAVVAGAGAWQTQEWRLGARNSDQAAGIARERESHANAARTAEADQRAIEFARMEANAHVTYQTEQRLAAAAAAVRDRDAAIVGLRNALAAAESRSGQAGGDPRARIGADDPATLRAVVRECTAEYSTMVGNAVGAGIAVTGLQEHAQLLYGLPSTSPRPERKGRLTKYQSVPELHRRLSLPARARLVPLQ